MATVEKVKPSHATVKRPLKKVKNTSLADFKLSKDVSVPSNELIDYSILLFGAKKIGKTKLSSLFPGTYFIFTEPGGKGLRVRGDLCTDWRTFKKIVQLLKRDPCKLVVLDTADNAFKQCDTYITGKLGVDHVSEEDWGKGWSMLRNEFSAELNRLLSLGKGVILISHATEKEIKRRDGTKYDRVQPSMSGQALDICTAVVDIWAYFDYDGTDRVLTIGGDEHVAAGHRLDERFQWNGKRLTRIYMSDDPETGYHNLLAAFNNQYEPRPDDVEDEDESPPAPLKKFKKLKKLVIKRR